MSVAQVNWNITALDGKFWQVNLTLARSVQKVTDCLLRKLEQRAQIKAKESLMCRHSGRSEAESRNPVH